jgi:hypothetical protein
MAAEREVDIRVIPLPPERTGGRAAWVVTETDAVEEAAIEALALEAGVEEVAEARREPGRRRATPRTIRLHLPGGAEVGAEVVASVAELLADHIERLEPDITIAPPAVLLQARRNARARAEFLEEVGALTSAQVAELAGSSARNRAALANRWRREGRIFAVTYRERLLYPAFQFDGEGNPRSLIAAVLAALPVTDPWAVALWFVACTGQLGDRRPIDLLETAPDAVIAAASRVTDLPF